MDYNTIPMMMNDLIDVFSALSDARSYGETAIFLAALLLLVDGWRVYWLVYSLPGIALGGLIGYGVGQSLADDITPEAFALLGGLIGWPVAALLHGVFVWAVGGFLTSLFFNALMGGAEAGLGTLVFIGGGIIFSIFYNLMRPIVTAVLGAALLSPGVGYSAVFIPVVAAVGFAIQQSRAQRRGKNVFTRKPLPESQRQAEQPRTRAEPRPKAGETTYVEYVDDGFDPNAEMPTVERDWR